MAHSNMPLHLIAIRMGRSPDAVRAKAVKAGLAVGEDAPLRSNSPVRVWWDT
jgi:hypothetical protein